MDRLPSDDHRITSGAVGAAWAMVAGLAAVIVLASALAPPKPTPPLTEQAALHAVGCTNDDATEDRLDRSPRD